MGSALRRDDTRTWLALAVAVGCFATASAVSIGRPEFAPPAVTAAIAIAGVLPAGLWATRIRRKTHALVAVGLWAAVILLGIGRAVADVLAADSTELAALTVALWTGTLAAGVATVYLGCREYGAPAQLAIGTDAIDGEGDRFSR